MDDKLKKKLGEMVKEFKSEETTKDIRIKKNSKKIHADVRFTGNLDSKKAYRACELSFTKYCSVSKTLEATAEISFSVYVNEEKVNLNKTNQY